MSEHALQIKSLDDIQALCTCGGWNFVSTRNNLTVGEKRQLVMQKYAAHLRRYDADPDTQTISVRDLVEGDMVDLVEIPELADEPSAEFEYCEVVSIERETEDCIVVGFNCNRALGMDPNTSIIIQRREDR